MSQIKNTFADQWRRLRGRKPGNPHYKSGPVFVKKPNSDGRLKVVKVITRFDQEGRPIE